jgi:hypothetical protein
LHDESSRLKLLGTLIADWCRGHNPPPVGRDTGAHVPGCRFIKAGVILVDLQPAEVLQRELDLEMPAEHEPKRDRSQLMGAMDAINGRYGNGTVHAASTGRSVLSGCGT